MLRARATSLSTQPPSTATGLDGPLSSAFVPILEPPAAMESANASDGDSQSETSSGRYGID